MPTSIALVEDHEDSRELLAMVLQRHGYEVIEFASAEQALESLGQRLVDVIVTDLTLPGLDGWQLIERLRADPRTAAIPVIAVTGRVDASPGSFDALVLKPIASEELLRAIEQVRGNHRPTDRSQTETTEPAPSTHRTPAISEPTAEQYRLLVQHAPSLLWRANVDGDCDWFNDSWLTFTGRTMEQEIGDGWAAGVHPDDLARCLAIYRAHFAARQPFEMVYRLRRHDGVHRWISDRGAPYTDGQGLFAGFIGSCVDVHERHELDAAKTRFMGMIAHELRTPLTPLRAYVHQLSRAIERSEVPRPDLAARMERNLQRLVATISHLGDASRLESGRSLGLEIAPFDLAIALREIVESARLTRFTRSPGMVPGDIQLHGADVSLSYPGDEKRLRQAVEHLLDNAIKFSPPGSVVVVTLGRAAAGPTVQVEDHGIGVPPGELAQLGHAYFRASNAPDQNYPGVGLGLTLAREICAAHGGTLSFVAAPSGGLHATAALGPIQAAAA